MTLRIADISDERFPSVHTDCQQIVKTADALGAEGCQVDLIVPRMANHLFLAPNIRKQLVCEYFNVEGHFDLRDILTWPASDLRAEKFFHGLVGPLASLLGRYDLIYTRNVLPLMITSALGLPVLFETYRVLPRTDPKVWRSVQLAARGRRFLGISSHSAYAGQVMVESGADPDCVAGIPNGFDPADLQNIPSKAEARARLGLPDDAPVAAYTGHIRPDKGMNSLVDLAEDRPDCHFVIVGGTAEEVTKIKSDLNTREIRNVVLSGQVPLTEVPGYLAAADVLLLPPTAGPLFKEGRTVLPMKTFTYLAMGRAIVAPDLPDTAGILEHDSNCLRVPPDNRKAAAQALADLAGNPDLANRLASQALKDSARFTWRERAKRLIEFLEHRLQLVQR